MKSKKLLLFIFVLISAFIFNIKGVFALDISIKDIKVDSKGGSPTISDINYSGNNINSSIVFNDVNDYVKLKITLNNKDNEKYTINSIKNNNKIDNLEVSYSYDDKTIKAKGTKDIYVTLKYNKKVTNKNISLNDLTITLNLIDSKGNGKNVDINPTTGDNIIKYVILFVIVLVVLLFSLILIKRRKGKGKGFFILLLALVPTVVIAKEKLSVDIKLTNITIKGEFLPYTVSVKDANGNITERTIIYGQQVGQLPEVSKNGYTFDKYVDDDNNEVTSETIVTDDMTVTPKFTVIEYDITYAYNGRYALNKTKYTVEDEFTLNNPTRLGYTFAGWTGSNGEAKQTSVTISHETGDKNYVANWSSNPNTPYKVVHRYPNLDGTYREVVQNLSGPTGEQVTPGLLPEEGFTGPSQLTEITIEAVEDEANIPTVTYTYTRNQYRLTVLHPEYIQEGDKSDLYYYGQQVTLTAKSRDNYTFNKWSNDTTDNPLVLTITGTTSIEALYKENVFNVTFNPNSATVSTESVTVNSGENINTLPTPTNIPARKVFAGWYTGLNDGVKVTEPYTPTGDITLFARFKDMPFNYVFNHPGECTFNGSGGVLTGSNCTYANGTNKYIDTGVNLYDTTNHDNDYEIGFTIVSYDPDIQVKQATFMNTKLEGNNYPGLVFRRNNEQNIYDFSSRNTSGANIQKRYSENIETVKIYRIYNEEDDVQEIFISLNGQAKVRVNDLSQFNPTFSLNVWFGAAPTDANASNYQRVLKGTLSNMYIKVGKYHE